MEILRTPAKHHHPRRTEAVTCFVVHSTGSTDAEKVDRYYRTSESGVCPHFLVLPGEVRQYVDLDRIAYHVGFSKEDARIYGEEEGPWTLWQGGQQLPVPYAGYDEWFARWPGKRSPLELPTGSHPNGRSVGVEMLCERGMCADSQYELLAELLRETAPRVGITLSRQTVIGHYDADPIARASSRGGTDPGPYFEWERLFRALGVS